MRILYVGPLWHGGTCLQRMRALEDLGYAINPVDSEPIKVKEKQKSLMYRVIRKVFGPRDLARANQKIIGLTKDENFDLVWLDKALTIKPETLEHVRRANRKTIILGYSPDYMGVKQNQSKRFIKSLPLYHIFFTTKSYGVEELESLGVQRVNFIGKAFDPHTHRPLEINDLEKNRFGGPVGFIGDYEIDRAKHMYYLAEHNIQVRIWGPNWEKKCRLIHPNMKIEGKPLWADDYAKGICSFDINLVFLRKVNKDLHTARSIEIPACGGFMLAERTREHLELFQEGKEAEFFSTKEEMLEKIEYYLTNEEKRREIARAGRERCLKSGYSNHDRLKVMMQSVGSLMKEV